MKEYIKQRRPAPRHTTSQPATRLRSEVVFGSPGRGCKGSGICMVFPATVSLEHWPCPHAACYIELNDNGLHFDFLREQLDARFLRRHFRWGLFEVCEPYRLPLFLHRKLNTNREMVIQPGVYRVFERSDYLSICFPVHEL